MQISSTESIVTDRDGLLRFHEAHASDTSLPLSVRQWHAGQAAAINSRREVWNWENVCQRARYEQRRALLT